MSKTFASNKFIKELAKKEILVPHLRRWWAAGEFPDDIDLKIKPNKVPDSAFHPSSHATLCDRTLYAVRMDHLPRRAISDDTQLAFMIGHMYHALIQWVVVEQLGFANWSHVERRGGVAMQMDTGQLEPWRQAKAPPHAHWWATGSADISHITIPGRTKPILVDIKTMNANAYRTNGLPANVDLKYRRQVQLYLDWHDVDEAIILCVEKDSPHRFREVLVKRDESVADSIYTQWDSVADYMQEGNVPDCTCEDRGKCPSLEVYV